MHLAGEIGGALPHFTQHEITHLDALWEMADIAAGALYPITPCEAFVLGCSFLVHDLGMSVAAYPGGLTELRGQRIWPDIVATILRKRNGRFPTREEILAATEDVLSSADRETLRLLHAERCQKLPRQRWGNERDNEYLIADQDIRNFFGDIIGKIGASHWWDVDALATQFSTQLGAPGWCPRDWTVDPLKIAALLRVADAMHVDSRRSPRILKLARNVSGTSLDHWTFQERMAKPRLAANGSIEYTAAPAFSRQEAGAWWTCHATLSQIHAELAATDALLRHSGRPPLLANGVAGIESSTYLSQYVPTIGWQPVDTRLRISNAQTLVERLGGAQLYGNDPTVVLRELIQNAADAVNARRRLQQSYIGGRIEVELGVDDQGAWLEISDNGIGMSKAVLTGPLLDFGASYWNSDLVLREAPGLAASGFEPNGTFGIGFFSVFMLSDEVTVRTRSWKEGPANSSILEFIKSGTRPSILRSAEESEWLDEPGTRVRIRLREARNTKEARRLLRLRDSPISLARRCEDVCVGCGVDLFVREAKDSSFTLVVPAQRWKEQDAASFLNSVISSEVQDMISRPENGATRDALVDLSKRIRPIVEPDGRIVGRAAIATDLRYFRGTSVVGVPLGCAVMGGVPLYAKYLGIAGMLEARPIRAARDLALPIASTQALSEWANGQAELLAKESISDGERLMFTEIVLGFGGDPGHMPIAFGASGWLTRENLRGWRGARRVVLVGIPGMDVKQEPLTPPRDDVLFVESNGYIPPDSATPSGRFEFLAVGVKSPDGTPEEPRRLQLSYGSSLVEPWSPPPNARPWLHRSGDIVLRSLAFAWAIPPSEIVVGLGDFHTLTGLRIPSTIFPPIVTILEAK